jgi:hypothetical protein
MVRGQKSTINSTGKNIGQYGTLETHVALKPGTRKFNIADDHHPENAPDNAEAYHGSAR